MRVQSRGSDSQAVGQGQGGFFDAVEGITSGATSVSTAVADIGHWGGSKEEARKAVEGIKKLKQDRQRAAQAVAKVEGADGDRGHQGL